MQTNREDCGSRYREIILPKPKSRAWADKASEAFRHYFTTIDTAKAAFMKAVVKSKYEYIANVAAAIPLTEAEAEEVPDSEAEAGS